MKKISWGLLCITALLLYLWGGIPALVNWIKFDKNPFSLISDTIFSPGHSCLNNFSSMEGGLRVYTTQIEFTAPIANYIGLNYFWEPKVQRIVILTNEDSHIGGIVDLGDFVDDGAKIFDWKGLGKAVTISHRFLGREKNRIKIHVTSTYQLRDSECAFNIGNTNY